MRRLGYHSHELLQQLVLPEASRAVRLSGAARAPRVCWAQLGELLDMEQVRQPAVQEEPDLPQEPLPPLQLLLAGRQLHQLPPVEHPAGAQVKKWTGEKVGRGTGRQGDRCRSEKVATLTSYGPVQATGAPGARTLLPASHLSTPPTLPPATSSPRELPP